LQNFSEAKSAPAQKALVAMNAATLADGAAKAAAHAFHAAGRFVDDQRKATMAVAASKEVLSAKELSEQQLKDAQAQALLATGKAAVEQAALTAKSALQMAHLLAIDPDLHK